MDGTDVILHLAVFVDHHDIVHPLLSITLESFHIQSASVCVSYRKICILYRRQHCSCNILSVVAQNLVPHFVFYLNQFSQERSDRFFKQVFELGKGRYFRWYSRTLILSKYTIQSSQCLVSFQRSGGCLRPHNVNAVNALPQQYLVFTCHILGFRCEARPALLLGHPYALLGVARFHLACSPCVAVHPESVLRSECIVFLPVLQDPFF